MSEALRDHRSTEREGGEARPAPWHAVWTKSNCEQFVTDQLGARGFELFFPQTMTWSRRAGVRRRIPAPLFPGYVFIRHVLDKTSHVEVLKARGVVRVLGGRWDQLEPIPTEEVIAVQRLVESGSTVFPYPHLHEGDRVRITGGPLKGVEGRFVKGNPERGLLVVSISLLQRSVAVDIDCTLVEAA